MRIFLLSVLLSLIPLLGNSQKSEPFSRRITYKEGLTTQTIFDLFIHPSGHLYLGTDLGLLRYNGNYFETIPALKNLDNAADNILIDHKDRIWCKNFSNQIFYLDGNQMIHLPELEKIFVEYKGLNRFTHLDGTLYFATTLAIIAYDIDGQKLEIIEEVDNSDEFQSFFLNLTAQENPRSLIYLENKRLKDYFNNRFLDIPVFGFGQIEFEWFEDDLWGIRRALGNELYNLSKGITWPLLGLSPSTSIYFVKNAGGNLWLCTSEGAFEFDKSQKKIIQSRLLGKRVTDVVADREGNLWFSTLDEGLFVFPAFNLLTTDLLNLSTEGNVAYTAMATTPFNTLLVGTNTGIIHELNSDGRIIQSFDLKTNQEIEFLFFDSKNQQIISSRGTIRYSDPNIRKLIYLGKKIAPDENGNFIMAHSNFSGIIKDNFATKPELGFTSNFPITAFNEIPDVMLVLNSLRSRTVHYSTINKKYYVGSVDDFRIYDTNGKSTTVRAQPDKELIVQDIKEDENGIIWLATSNNGLLALVGEDIIKQADQDEGLELNQATKLAISEQTIFAINPAGIFAYSLASRKVEKIWASYVLRGIKLNDILIKDDFVWLATSSGVFKFLLDESNPTTIPGFSFKKITNIHNELIEAPLRIPYFENDIRLHFDLVHLSSFNGATIYYRINSNGGDWQTLSGAEEYLMLNSLAPGTYTVEAKAFANGLFSDIITSTFSISPPYYQTLWFRIGGILLIVGMTTLSAIRYRKKLRKKEEVRLQLASSQIKAIRSQMNPHFMFNVLNTVQGYIYGGQRSEAAEYLGKFSDLMRRTLEESDQNFIPIQNEINLLELYLELEKPRFEENFQYEIQIDPSISLDQITIPSMILQPFVENAVKHGLMHKEGGKKLHISIAALHKNALEIKIIDNGIGRKRSSEINQKRKNHKSFATDAIFSRLNLINQTLNQPIELKIEDPIEGGTIVILKMPYFYE